MKVLFFLRYFRNQASSRVRGFYMAEELKRKGIHCAIMYGYNKKAYSRFLLNLVKYDIIYFQKRYSETDIKLNKLARFLGKKTFFDLDDAPGGVKLAADSERLAIEMIRCSSGAVVGSHQLKDFARNYNEHVYLLPSSINLNYYGLLQTAHSDDITLGWIGNGIGYKKDLQMLVKPLRILSQKYHIKFILVGALGQKEIHEQFETIKDLKAEIIDSVNWASPIEIPSIISQFDLGLYPLIDNQYNQYKCGYKALQYMAMERPVVASPVAENTFIIEHSKDGFLVSSAEEWVEALSQLIEDAQLRKDIGKLGRTKIEGQYSLQISAAKLLKVFNAEKDEN